MHYKKYEINNSLRFGYRFVLADIKMIILSDLAIVFCFFLGNYWGRRFKNGRNDWLILRGILRLRLYIKTKAFHSFDDKLVL